MTSRPPLWTDLAARATGLWILAGCLAKAFLGTPADLPAVVRGVPLAAGTTFALVLGVEAFVGLATLARPGRAWPAAAALLLAFAAVLATQVAAGSASCGCFGATISAPPAAMLAVDAGFLALLLLARPWRLARGGRADVATALAALVVAVALPLLVDREAKPGDPGVGTGGLRKWAKLDVASWKGKKIGDTDLARWADLSGARDGLWLLYRESCEICADCLQKASVFERGERELTLVRLGEAGAHRVVHVLPTGPFVHAISLPDTVDWVVTAPARLVVEGGVVTSAKPGLEPDDCP